MKARSSGGETHVSRSTAARAEQEALPIEPSPADIIVAFEAYQSARQQAERAARAKKIANEQLEEALANWIKLSKMSASAARARQGGATVTNIADHRDDVDGQAALLVLDEDGMAVEPHVIAMDEPEDGEFSEPEEE